MWSALRKFVVCRAGVVRLLVVKVRARRGIRGGVGVSRRGLAVGAGPHRIRAVTVALPDSHLRATSAFAGVIREAIALRTRVSIIDDARAASAAESLSAECSAAAMVARFANLAGLTLRASAAPLADIAPTPAFAAAVVGTDTIL